MEATLEWVVDVSDPTDEDEDDDASLVLRAQLGDGRALDRLFRRHREKAWRFALFLSRSPEDAEDLVQAACVAVIEGLSGIEHPERFGTWFLGIVRNIANTFFRSLTRWLRISSDEEGAFLERIASTAASPEQLAELRQLDPILGEVGREARAMWLMSYSGHTYPELAEIYEVSEATIGRRLRAVTEHIEKRIGGGK